MAAKNNASEKALRDIIIQRMTQTPRGIVIKSATDAQLPSNTGKLEANLFLTCVEFPGDNLIEMG